MDYVLVSTEKFYRRFLPVKVTLENIYIFAENLAQFFFKILFYAILIIMLPLLIFSVGQTCLVYHCTI